MTVNALITGSICYVSKNVNASIYVPLDILGCRVDCMFGMKVSEQCGIAAANGNQILGLIS